MMKDLKKLWPYLRPNGFLVTIAVTLIPAILLLEMGIPLTIRRAVDSGMVARDQSALIFWALAYLILTILQYAARTSQAMAATLAVHRMIRVMRNDLCRHIMRLSCRFHDRTLSGTLVTRATGDFENLSESLNLGVLTAVVDLAMLGGSLLGLFFLSRELSYATIAVLPIVVIAVAWFSQALKRALLASRSKAADLNAFTQECFYGVETIKILNAQPAALEKEAALNQDFRRAQMSSVVLDSAMFAFIDGLSSITMGIVLFAALSSWFDVPGISAGLLVAFLQYIQQMFEPVKNLSNKIAVLQGALTSMSRIFGVLETKSFVEGREPLGRRLKGHIVFRHVSFSYADEGGSEHQGTLKDVSFEVQPGDNVALVGATGSGKSTIVKLLSKLYDGFTGEILIDGMDLKNIDETSLRSQMAIVPQDLVIFQGSVLFNICLKAESASIAAVERAARAVGAHTFIEQLPGGYDFDLNEGGSNLSQGQRQLIVFARALIHDPSIVILDEATASVDPQSEALVQKGFEALCQGRTVLVIAHRLSTIEHCKEILVVDRGRIVEHGSHEELLKMNGAYKRLSVSAMHVAAKVAG